MSDVHRARDECGPGAAAGRESTAPTDDDREKAGADQVEDVIEIPLGTPVSEEELRAMKEAARRSESADES